MALNSIGLLFVCFFASNSGRGEARLISSSGNASAISLHSSGAESCCVEGLFSWSCAAGRVACVIFELSQGLSRFSLLPSLGLHLHSYYASPSEASSVFPSQRQMWCCWKGDTQLLTVGLGEPNYNGGWIKSFHRADKACGHSVWHPCLLVLWYSLMWQDLSQDNTCKLLWTLKERCYTNAEWYYVYWSGRSKYRNLS